MDFATGQNQISFGFHKQIPNTMYRQSRSRSRRKCGTRNCICGIQNRLWNPQTNDQTCVLVNRAAVAEFAADPQVVSGIRIWLRIPFTYIFISNKFFFFYSLRSPASSTSITTLISDHLKGLSIAVPFNPTSISITVYPTSITKQIPVKQN